MTDASDASGPDDEQGGPERPLIDPAILADAAAGADLAHDGSFALPFALPFGAPRGSASPGTAEVPGRDAAGSPAEAAVSSRREGGDTGLGEDLCALPGTADLAPTLALDVADPDAEALAEIPLTLRIEAALFAATEPLTLKRMKELTACRDGRLVRESIDALAAYYVEQGRAFRIQEVAQGFQFRTSAEVAVVVQRLGRRPSDEKLSTAALETLAVVAYRQPVMRVDIERIRGVACGEVLRALQERGLVRAAGRAELPGSPILYGTTQRFLEVFGLRDIVDLPKDREVLRRSD